MCGVIGSLSKTVSVNMSKCLIEMQKCLEEEMDNDKK